MRRLGARVPAAQVTRVCIALRKLAVHRHGPWKAPPAISARVPRPDGVTCGRRTGLSRTRRSPCPPSSRHRIVCATLRSCSDRPGAQAQAARAPAGRVSESLCIVSQGFEVASQRIRRLCAVLFDRAIGAHIATRCGRWASPASRQDRWRGGDPIAPALRPIAQPPL